MQITIIGAGAGISNAVARLFGGQGFSVGLIARNEEKLTVEAAALNALGVRAAYAVGDAGDGTSLRAALDKIAGELGPADIVLYNAYTRAFKGIEKETWAGVQEQMNVNAGGAFHLLQYLLPNMKAANAGKLFFTGGGLSLAPQPNLIGLGMGKAALRNLVHGVAGGLKNSNVHLATVTVCGYVNEKDPKYNPNAIAAEFWKLYQQQPGGFETEIVY